MLLLLSLVGAAMLALFFRPTSAWTSIVAYTGFVFLKDTIAPVAYGFYAFVEIGLFYVLVGNVVASVIKFHSAEIRETVVWFGRIHIAMAYCLAGLGKAVGVHWWTGESMWRAINGDYLSDMRLVSVVWLGHYPIILQATGILVVCLECLYPLVFIRAVRVPILFSAIVMHIGIILFQGLWLFGLVMIAFNVFVFFSFNMVPKSQPHRERNSGDVPPIKVKSHADSTLEVVT